MAERWVVNASPVILLAKAEVIRSGIIVLAKQRGFIAHAKPALEKLRGAGAWVSDELIDRAIALAGEA